MRDLPPETLRIMTGSTPDPGSHPWQGVVAAIATKHGKQRQFQPPLHELVGVDLIVADVDTDQLGTFSGEVPRPESPLETGRRKAHWAVDHTGARIGLASEGSFGPHPDVPFVTMGLELAVCVDPGDELEIVERAVSTDTNFHQLEVSGLPVPQKFLRAARFPSHALVVSPPGQPAPLFKGLQDLDAVEHAVARCVEHAGRALVQTDMRAHLNPTRQHVLTGLSHRLARRLCQFCPACTAPGWGVVDVETGLPCAWCARPTPLVACEVDGCSRRGCDERLRRPRATVAPAGHCPACNP